MRNQSPGNPWESDERLRIITFYKQQVAEIRALLNKNRFERVSIGTVDSAQGCEADVVIVSFVKGHGTIGFLKDDRRLNVALTRARHQLICIGNVRAMEHLQGYDAFTLRAVSRDALARGVVTG
jgi:superfamily I DNA and/or RNA helicase